MSRYRNYCFTLNNYTDEHIEILKNLEIFTYIIFGEEIAPTTGTKHLQGYFEMEEGKTINSLIKKYLPKGIHLEQAKGNAEQNKTYCSKGSNIFEKGTAKKQGKRTDLENLADEIKNGRPVDNICIEKPALYHQYGRTLHRLEDIYLREKFRTWMTTCDWYYGPTGIGKSHKAFENFDPKKCYVWKDDNGWQDGYTGQETLIINEFRGEITYKKLLEMIDKYPCELKRRGREPVPFLAKHIIITSALHPRDVYHNLSAQDSMEQFYRRVKIYTKEISQENSQEISQENSQKILQNKPWIIG